MTLREQLERIWAEPGVRCPLHLVVWWLVPRERRPRSSTGTLVTLLDKCRNPAPPCPGRDG